MTVTFFGHQFITLTVDMCAQHGGPEAPRSAGLSAAAETGYFDPLGVRSIAISASVCLSVFLSAHIYQQELSKC